MHMFQKIESLFCPNDTTDKDHTKLISIKNPKKGNASWSTTKTVIGWAIGTDKQVLPPPPIEKR